MSTRFADQQYESLILGKVSRSFALTIPQLPPELRGAVTNAYLVCRIVDTIEDENELPLERKIHYFREFIAVINGRGSAEEFANSLYPLLTGSTLSSERELVGNTPLILRGTSILDPLQQAAIRRCASIMALGMSEFQQIRNPFGLEGLPQLERYCYHVAGVVGEMLTELFCGYSAEICRNRERLMELAVSFGQGLQMVNIIKDFWEDRGNGACWLPRDIFEKAGCDLNGVSAEHYSDSFGRGLEALIGIAGRHLKNALEYTLLIPQRENGIRKFCLWAIGMAIFTLRNLNRRRDYRSGRDVKISRKALKSIILVSNLSLQNDFMLKGLFNLTTKDLSSPRQVM